MIVGKDFNRLVLITNNTLTTHIINYLLKKTKYEIVKLFKEGIV